MQLSSARDLKLELQDELVATQPLVAYRYRTVAPTPQHAMLLDGLTSLHDHIQVGVVRHRSLPAVTPALGIARLGEARFGLAVRVQAPVAASRSVVNYFAERARGEVDVRVVPQAMAYQLDVRARHRPVCGGISVGHPSVRAGTVCCFVRTVRGVELLSANHVLAAGNAGRTGDPVLQPALSDEGELPRDRVGGLTAVVPLVLGQPNKVDAAVCSLDEGVEPVLESGRTLADGTTVEETVLVRKTGRTTATTVGRIRVLELDGISLDVPGLGPVEYDGVLEIVGDTSPFSEPGDSGALVTSRDGTACIGMVIGGDGDEVTWATPLEPVLGTLGATLAG